MLDQNLLRAAQQLEDWATGLEYKAQKFQDLRTQVASTAFTHATFSTVCTNGASPTIRFEA